jgi:hypothetical protein
MRDGAIRKIDNTLVVIVEGDGAAERERSGGRRPGQHNRSRKQTKCLRGRERLSSRSFICMRHGGGGGGGKEAREERAGWYLPPG